jgi:hypothetical protein
MPINFDKRLTQAYCQRIVEGIRAADPHVKYNFKDYQLTETDSNTLSPMAKKDAVGLFFNALVSFAHGCHSIEVGCVSWACVELYYSIFYACRTELYYHDYILIRDGGLYLVKIAKDEHPIQKNNKVYNTDHGGSLRHFIDVFGASDYLCSNTINADNVYLWLMDLRETTHYRHKYFNEPGSFQELSKLVARIQTGGVADVLRNFKTDFDTYCFSDNHAWLCAPYYKLIEVGAMYKAGVLKLNSDQDDYIRKVFKGIGMKEAEIQELIG